MLLKRPRGPATGVWPARALARISSITLIYDHLQLLFDLPVWTKSGRDISSCNQYLCPRGRLYRTRPNYCKRSSDVLFTLVSLLRTRAYKRVMCLGLNE